MGFAMLKKRIIGVITVRDGLAVQSIGFSRYLPLGNPTVIAENLDRWGVDEILIQCIDRTVYKLGPDYDLIRSVADQGISTPLIYGGGIATNEHARSVIANGADRILLESVFFDSPDIVRQIAFTLGSQAVIASVPLTTTFGGVSIWDYRSHRPTAWPSVCTDLFSESLVSEVLLIDKDHEGVASSFDFSFLDTSFLSGISLIAFGGISDRHQVETILSQPNVAAVAIGNFLNYREHAVQVLKKSLLNSSIRAPYFSPAHSAVL